MRPRFITAFETVPDVRIIELERQLEAEYGLAWIIYSIIIYNSYWFSTTSFKTTFEVSASG